MFRRRSFAFSGAVRCYSAWRVIGKGKEVVVSRACVCMLRRDAEGDGAALASKMLPRWKRRHDVDCRRCE